MRSKPSFSLAGLTAAMLAWSFGGPAQAQGLFAFFSQPQVQPSSVIVCPTCPPPPSQYRRRVLPTAQPEHTPLEFTVRSRTRVASLPKAEKLKRERKISPISRRVNPLPLILNDETLRPGDVVMFPDGPRLFRGSGATGNHRVSDFERFVTAAKRLSKSARDSIAKLKAGMNEAWSDTVLKRDGTLRDTEIAENPYKDKIAPADEEEPRRERRRAQRSTGIGTP